MIDGQKDERDCERKAYWYRATPWQKISVNGLARWRVYDRSVALHAEHGLHQHA